MNMMFHYTFNIIIKHDILLLFKKFKSNNILYIKGSEIFSSKILLVITYKSSSCNELSRSKFILKCLSIHNINYDLTKIQELLYRDYKNI